MNSETSHPCNDSFTTDLTSTPMKAWTTIYLKTPWEELRKRFPFHHVTSEEVQSLSCSSWQYLGHTYLGQTQPLSFHWKVQNQPYFHRVKQNLWNLSSKDYQQETWSLNNHLMIQIWWFSQLRRINLMKLDVNNN